MASDVVIVGGGLVGCLMAAKLCEHGVGVTILEAGTGPAAPDYPHPERDRYTSAGSVDYRLNTTRVKAVGGTTNHWGGYTPRFVEADFQSRTVSGVGADWPIGYADLEPYYSRAEEELGIAGNDDNAHGGFRSRPYPMPARGVPPDLRDRFSALGVELCSQPTAKTTRAWQGRPPQSNYRAHEVHLPRALSSGRCQLITDATATRLETDKTGYVTRAVFRGLADRAEKSVEAPLFVLGCGGVETPRLLLLSKSERHPQGLANGSGLVGRFFMDHHRTNVFCEFEEPVSMPFARALSFQYNARAPGTRDIGVLLTIKASPQPADLIRQYFWGRALRERVLADSTTELLISGTVEGIPSRDNTVDLDPAQLDAFGLPVPRITYSLNPEIEAGLARAREICSDIASKLRPAASQVQGDVYLDHHMGTCRMADDPADGVVDRHLVAHGVPNLMIVGSSVFVTGACVNPSLTIAALALRAVDHILQSRAG